MLRPRNSKIRIDEFADALVGILKLRYDSIEDLKEDKIRKTEIQTCVLLRIFAISNFPSTETRENIAILIGLPKRTVQIWFQNRRQKYRKDAKDTQHDEHGNAHPIIVDSDRITLTKIIQITLEEQERFKRTPWGM
ncbi:Homeodomain-like protein [Pseudoloma neurophilia]|uniref:Homeodomain-like protein n=1 Tax=Pseudoloma neurophilia TaxID=146866 RepID=A0A0R0M0V7_9MICR|nr:Homeodomain-like protein [Pseudoloma neurophilia]